MKFRWNTCGAGFAVLAVAAALGDVGCSSAPGDDQTAAPASSATNTPPSATNTPPSATNTPPSATNTAPDAQPQSGVYPLVEIPASPETTAATGIVHWDAYRLGAGEALVAGWDANGNVVSSMKTELKDKQVSFRFGRLSGNGGAVTLDASGKVADSWLNAHGRNSVKKLSFLANDSARDGQQPYGCMADVISMSGTVLSTVAACATAPETLVTIAGCIGGAASTLGAGALVLEDCTDGTEAVAYPTGSGRASVEICEYGNGCVLYDETDPNGVVTVTPVETGCACACGGDFSSGCGCG